MLDNVKVGDLVTLNPDFLKSAYASRPLLVLETHIVDDSSFTSKRYKIIVRVLTPDGSSRSFNSKVLMKIK